MLDFIEKTAEDDAANRCMEEFYSKTLESFQSTNNDRLWLKTNIKLARLWLDQKNYAPLTDKLRELHKSCQLPDGSDDPSKGTLSLEIYALEIMMYEEMRNNKRMKVSKRVSPLVVGPVTNTISSPGLIPAGPQGSLGRSASPNSWNHPTMRWQDASWRR